MSLELADASSPPRFEDKIGHIFYTSQPGRKSSGIYIEYISNNDFLLEFSQFKACCPALGKVKLAVYSAAKGSFGDSIDLCSRPTTKLFG